MALYRSLEKYCPDFHLYIFAFDQTTVDIVKKLDLPKATVVTVAEFENPELIKVRAGRTAREYYWTCTPAIILYSLRHFNLDMCTYVDADMLFFDSPKVLLDELGKGSILITGHRYDPGHDKSYKLGKYCVQFNSFKNNDDGMKALTWWYERCLEWCYARVEDGKFGDQKYLDDWPQRFSGVHELWHLGGGVAPWNAGQYDFDGRNGKTWLKETGTGKEFPLIFYHFHQTKLYKIAGHIRIKSGYQAINQKTDLRTLVYQEYERAISNALTSLNKLGFTPTFTGTADYFARSLRESLPSWLKRPVKKLIR